MTQTPYTDQFWESLRNGTFLIHACETCGSRFFPPSPFCPYCQATTVKWEESPGTGSLYSITRQHVTAPDFDDELVAGVVELDEGPRLLVPMNAPYEELKIGDRVRIEPCEYPHDFDRRRLNGYPFFIAKRMEE